MTTNIDYGMQQIELLLFVNTVLLGLVGFFLRSLFSRFEKLEAEVKTAIINSAVENQRVVQIERDLIDLKQMVMSRLFDKKISNS